MRIFCDESCHLENDGIPVMVLGALWGEREGLAALSAKVKVIRESHGLSGGREIKWQKVSVGEGAFYQEVLEAFLAEPAVYFRGLVVPDKTKLDHGLFEQDHHDWYYKMFYSLLKPLLQVGKEYEIFLDVKDTHSRGKVSKLRKILTLDSKIPEFKQLSIENTRSDRSIHIQLCDLIIGAIAYENRGLSTNPAKLALVAKLKMATGLSLRSSTSLSAQKFNLFVWKPQPKEASE